jgi:hypothetical protein
MGTRILHLTMTAGYWLLDTSSRATSSMLSLVGVQKAADKLSQQDEFDDVENISFEDIQRSVVRENKAC